MYAKIEAVIKKDGQLVFLVTMKLDKSGTKFEAVLEGTDKETLSNVKDASAKLFETLYPSKHQKASEFEKHVFEDTNKKLKMSKKIDSIESRLLTLNHRLNQLEMPSPENPEDIDFEQEAG